ncbi:MAG TPA: M20 family metallopeptidase [Candidatus Sulfotelmatobacter sp.]|nr:M20 family metallopeptidase [Candidatus Sulfotelmatobacter sp.]
MTLDELKAVARGAVEGVGNDLIAISRYLHANPEVAYGEEKAAAHLTGYLERQGFRVERHVGGLPTAFRATFGAPAGTAPAIAFLAEYDALPGLGHACGHNLIATGSVGAALGARALLDRVPGRIVVAGCPAEERGGGKIALARAGLFDGCAAAMLVHPSNRTEIVKLALGMRPLRVEFFGRASHAAAAPHQGVNALDGVLLAFAAIGALRQQVRSDARIHGIIVHGGEAPNIIPAYAAARFMVRALDREYLEELSRRVVACFEGAAAATGCRLKVEPEGADYQPFLPNRALGALFRRNLEALGVPVDQGPEDSELGSTDVGNVSWVAPTLHPTVAICGPEATCHMPAFAEAAASDRGHAGMLAGAKAMAMTAADLLGDQAARDAVRSEFSAARGGA